ncbi:unnamed protein product [Amoebophrya sp. A25]|nr:unnamed protein product [Amoebophrya sp. A25]|eukprot:GSA25T00007475001.1
MMFFCFSSCCRRTSSASLWFLATSSAIVNTTILPSKNNYTFWAVEASAAENGRADCSFGDSVNRLQGIGGNRLPRSYKAPALSRFNSDADRATRSGTSGIICSARQQGEGDPRIEREERGGSRQIHPPSRGSFIDATGSRNYHRIRDHGGKNSPQSQTPQRQTPQSQTIQSQTPQSQTPQSRTSQSGQGGPPSLPVMPCPSRASSPRRRKGSKQHPCDREVDLINQRRAGAASPASSLHNKCAGLPSPSPTPQRQSQISTPSPVPPRLSQKSTPSPVPQRLSQISTPSPVPGESTKIIQHEPEQQPSSSSTKQQPSSSASSTGVAVATSIPPLAGASNRDAAGVAEQPLSSKTASSCPPEHSKPPSTSAVPATTAAAKLIHPQQTKPLGGTGISPTSIDVPVISESKGDTDFPALPPVLKTGSTLPSLRPEGTLPVLTESALPTLIKAFFVNVKHSSFVSRRASTSTTCSSFIFYSEDKDKRSTTTREEYLLATALEKKCNLLEADGEDDADGDVDEETPRRKSRPRTAPPRRRSRSVNKANRIGLRLAPCSSPAAGSSDACSTSTAAVAMPAASGDTDFHPPCSTATSREGRKSYGAAGDADDEEGEADCESAESSTPDGFRARRNK